MGLENKMRQHHSLKQTVSMADSVHLGKRQKNLTWKTDMASHVFTSDNEDEISNLSHFWGSTEVPGGLMTRWATVCHSPENSECSHTSLRDTSPQQWPTQPHRKKHL